jgi:hypothetical protein
VSQVKDPEALHFIVSSHLSLYLFSAQIRVLSSAVREMIAVYVQTREFWHVKAGGAVAIVLQRVSNS